MKMCRKNTKCSTVQLIDSNLIMDTRCDARMLIDVREPNMFHKSHIKDAHSIFISNLLMRRLQRGSLNISNVLPEHVRKRISNENCASIIIYDENSSNENNCRRISVIATALKKTFPKKHICLLNGGFAKFCETYPTHCDFDYPVDCATPFQLSLFEREVSKDPTDLKDSDVVPVAILPFLYLGSAVHSSQKDVLDKLGITAIMNVSRTCPVLFSNNYHYKTIPVNDNEQENISAHFDEAIKFIDEVKDNDGKILVHCRAGISRSATICIAYLIRKYGYTLDQAYDYTKKRRTKISPNLNFLGQLLNLERLTRNDNSLDLKVPANESSSPPLMFSYSPKSCVYSYLNKTAGGGERSPFRFLLTPS